MFNQVFLIGYLHNKPSVINSSSLVKDYLVEVELYRPYNDEVGKRLCDTISCIAWEGISQKVSDICEVGSLLAIKGRLINDQVNMTHDKFHNSIVKIEHIEIINLSSPELNFKNLKE